MFSVTMETEALQQRPISEHFSNLLPLRLFPSFSPNEAFLFPSRLVINPGSMISVLVAQLWGLVLSSVQENVPKTRHRHRVWASTATNCNSEPKPTPSSMIWPLVTPSDLLLPRILASNNNNNVNNNNNKIQAQIEGMFYQCNWTAWLQGALLLDALWSILCAK